MPSLNRELYPESKFEPSQLYLQFRSEAQAALLKREGIGSGELLFPGIEKALNMIAAQCENDEERIAAMRAIAADPNSVDLGFLLGACASALKAEQDGQDWARRFVAAHKPEDISPHVGNARGTTDKFLAESGV